MRLTIEKLRQEEVCIESQQYLLEHWGEEADLFEVIETVSNDGHEGWGIYLLKMFMSKPQWEEFLQKCLVIISSDTKRKSKVESNIKHIQKSHWAEIAILGQLYGFPDIKDAIKLGISMLRGK